MPFEITPVVVGSGLPAPGTPAEPVNTTSFGPTPAPAPSGIPGTPPSFLQWKYEGDPLGDNDVLIVDFVYPLIANDAPVSVVAGVTTSNAAVPVRIDAAVVVRVTVDAAAITPDTAVATQPYATVALVPMDSAAPFQTMFDSGGVGHHAYSIDVGAVPPLPV